MRVPSGSLVDIGRSPDGRRRRGIGILARMISIPLLVIATVTLAIGALLRPFLGRWIDARNIAQLRRRYSLDESTAEELYQLARLEGFGSAWETVVDGRGTSAGGLSSAARRSEPRTGAEPPTADSQVDTGH